MGIAYVFAAMAVVPGLLGAFRLLSRPPAVTSQPPAPAPAVATAPVGRPAASIADEAEEWLRQQSRS